MTDPATAQAAAVDIRWFVQATQSLDAAMQAAERGDSLTAALHAGMAKSAFALQARSEAVAENRAWKSATSAEVVERVSAYTGTRP